MRHRPLIGCCFCQIWPLIGHSVLASDWLWIKQVFFSRLDCHKEKVQAVSWHPFDHHTLVTGACDSYVRVFDCRTVGQHKKWSAGQGCEVERVVWDHFNPHRLLASTEKGQVVCVDLRWVT